MKYTTEIFIEKAKQIHGDKYDYSQVEYINSATPVSIICSLHGEFKQIPNNHLKGYGCKICAHIHTTKQQTPTTEQFIQRAQQVHGNKYDYSKVVYKNAKTPVIIICPIHGEFEQLPYEHIRRKGCPKCSRHQLTKEQFITKAKLIHGDKYDYSKVNYINTTTKICIICPKHGEFYQLPTEHLKGHGCGKCSMSILERNIANMLDSINVEYDYNQFYKWLGNLQLDFYIPTLNIAIECQGKQHFEIVDFGGKDYDKAKQEFNKRIYNDNKKLRICNKLGIKLLYYSNIDKENMITDINIIQSYIQGYLCTS